MNTEQTVLLFAGVVIILLTLISHARRRRERGPSPQAYAREMRTKLREEQAVRTDLAELLDQLQQVAREVNAQLDAKFIRLERTMEHADRRIDSLERLVREARGSAGLDVTVDDSGEQAAVASPAAACDNEQILARARAGGSASEIAAKTGRPIGEVELILALRSKQDVLQSAALQR